MTIAIDGRNLTIEKLVRVARNNEKIKVSEEAWKRIEDCRAFLDDVIAKSEVMYGVTTGIGDFSEIILSKKDIIKFQKYLIFSHSAGVGEPMRIEDVRGAILSRINVNCRGLSGIRGEVVAMLVEMLNRGVTPVVPIYGSVGASGDLAPMSHIALVLIGEGEAFFEGKRYPGKIALGKAGLKPIKFKERDGLAFINGCNVIASKGALILWDSERLVKTSEIATAMTLEALNGNLSAFDERIHRARGFAGSIVSAENIRKITRGSKMLSGALGKKRVQDAYSLRSSSQVIGAVKDAIKWASSQFAIELNGVGDNPLFFHKERKYLAGGNFQGTPLAIPLEAVGISLCTLAVLSERRLNRLLNPNLSQGLPPFLTNRAGIMSGLMVAQYTADALVADCRVNSTPSATLSIPAAADQEDFVSMGMTTAIKTRHILEQAERVVAIELLASARAIDFRAPYKPGKGTRIAHEIIREEIPFTEEDEPLSPIIEKITALVKSGKILHEVEKVIGKLK